MRCCQALGDILPGYCYSTNGGANRVTWQYNVLSFYYTICCIWILVSIVRNYVHNKISNKYVNHGTLIELIWTISPAIILILIAFPSFKLLYLMDEVTDPSLTLFAEGHQWYWSYEYPDSQEKKMKME